MSKNTPTTTTMTSNCPRCRSHSCILLCLYVFLSTTAITCHGFQSRSMTDLRWLTERRITNIGDARSSVSSSTSRRPRRLSRHFALTDPNTLLRDYVKSEVELRELERMYSSSSSSDNMAENHNVIRLDEQPILVNKNGSSKRSNNPSSPSEEFATALAYGGGTTSLTSSTTTSPKNSQRRRRNGTTVVESSKANGTTKPTAASSDTTSRLVVEPASMRSSTHLSASSETSLSSSEETSSSTTQERSRFQRIFSDAAQRANNNPKLRSSTMPGFGGSGGGSSAVANRKRRRRRTRGKKTNEEEESKAAAERKRRMKVNTENLYRRSPSVPDSFVDFTTQIHQETERITPQEELTLGNLTQEAVRLQDLFDRLEDKYGREPTDDEWCAAAGKINMVALQEAMDDGIEAKNKLVTSNLRLVQGVVNVYLRNGLSGKYNVADMMSEGILALIRAAEKYDPERGFRFSTYAMYWIRAAVKRAQLSQSRVVSVPHRQYHTYKAILKQEREFASEKDRKPTVKELSAIMGMTEKQINRCKDAMSKKEVSLDAMIQYKTTAGYDSGAKESVLDLVADSRQDLEMSSFKRQFIRESLLDLLTTHLEPLEVRLLMLRFGLMEGDDYKRPMTLVQVANACGMKTDKTRRTIMGSLDKLQTYVGDEWRSTLRELTD